MQRRPLTVTAVAAASLIAMPVTTALAMPAAGTGDREVALSSAVPSWVSAPAATTPHVTGRAAASARVDVSLQLPMRNQRLAEQYVAQGKVISQAEYDRTFGATEAQVDKVATWLRSKGMTVTSVDRVTGAVGASSSVFTVQRALKTIIATAQTKGHHGLVPIQAPTLPASLGVTSVVGLNTMVLTRPHRVTQPSFGLKGRSTTLTSANQALATPAVAGDTRCARYWGSRLNTSVKPFANQSNYLCGYYPQDLPRMYGVTGARSLAPTVAILGAYDVKNMKAITNTYMTAAKYRQLASYTSYPAANPRYQSECGGTMGWGSEQALDVQASHAIAPAARILYYGSRSCALGDMLTSFQQVVRDRKASTVSMSFGSSTDAGYDAGLNDGWNKATLQASLAGISVFASSGDNGNNSELDEPTKPVGVKGVGIPSAFPYVTSVGGTSEGLNASGKVVARTGWEDQVFRRLTRSYQSLGFYSGAGGGVSSRWAQPSWQVGKVPAGRRAVPDVAALADPFTGFVSRDSLGYQTTGGTSLAAPVVASVVALSKAQTKRKVGLASPFLYKLLGTSALNDVKPSSTGVYLPADPATGAPGHHVVGFDRRPQRDLQSKARWDNVTGVGTPNGASFLSAFGK
jgi:subtilase family serine protease